MNRNPVQKFFLLSLFTSIALLSADEGVDCCEWEECYDVTYSTLSVSHWFGRGIGYDSGYTSFEALLFPFPCCEKVAPYLDLRVHYLDDNDWAANGGLGIRFMPDHSNFIYGINGYFDYRSDEGRDIHFTQGGIGLELIGCRMDLRANGYFPIKKSHTIQKCRFFYGDEYFVFRDRIRHALTGGDVEFGMYLNCRPQCIEFYAAVGGYFYGGDVYVKPVGGRFRFLVTYSDYFSLQGLVTHDNLFKTRFQGEIAIHIPFGCPPPRECVRLRNLSRRPFRNEIIPIEEYCCWDFNY